MTQGLGRPLVSDFIVHRAGPDPVIPRGAFDEFL